MSAFVLCMLLCSATMKDRKVVLVPELRLKWRDDAPEVVHLS
jgi:hypothetical protein